MEAFDLRPRARATLWWMVVAAGLFAVVAAIGPDRERASGGEDSGRPRASESAEWRAQGAWLSQQKSEMKQRGGEWAAGTSALPPLLSVPLDITRDGIYVLRAGPVKPSEFDGSLILARPPDTDFVLKPTASPILIQTGEETFVELQVQASGVTRPYVGFRVWLY